MHQFCSLIHYWELLRAMFICAEPKHLLPLLGSYVVVEFFVLKGQF